MRQVPMTAGELLEFGSRRDGCGAALAWLSNLEPALPMDEVIQTLIDGDWGYSWIFWVFSRFLGWISSEHPVMQLYSAYKQANRVARDANELLIQRAYDAESYTLETRIQMDKVYDDAYTQRTQAFILELQAWFKDNI